MKTGFIIKKIYEESINCNNIPKALLIKENENYKEAQEYNKELSSIHEAGHTLMHYLNGTSSFNVSMSMINPNVTYEIYKQPDAKETKKMI